MAWVQNPDGSYTEVSDQGPQYRNPYQFPGGQAFTWTPQGQGSDPGEFDYTYGWALLNLADKVRAGRATPQEQQEYAAQRQAALAIPQRPDPTTMLRTIPQGTGEEGGIQPQDWSRTLWQGSPDWPGIMTTLGDKVAAGTATPEETKYYQDTYRETVERTLDASRPDDAGLFGLGTPFGAVMALMSLAGGGASAAGALGTLGLGAAGAAGAAGATGASLGSTLGAVGTLAGLGGTGAGALGAATGQDWLSKLGMGLGAIGGLAGGVGGLTNLFGSGVNSLSDAARLASSTGKIASAVGAIPGAGAAGQAGRYLGLAGQAGALGSSLGADDWLGWGGNQAPLTANRAPNVPNLTRAADVATQRGRASMADFSYDDFLGWGGNETQQPWYSPQTMDWSGVTSGSLPTTWEQYNAGNYGATQYAPFTAPAAADVTSGSGSWLSSVLGGLGSVGKFLGSNASWLGPAASTLGSLGAGAIGSNAAGNASAAQANALNRGLDLQTAQWLQSQANQAPWLQAGQQALGHLTGRMGWEGPQQPGATPAISGANYALPGTTPGWTPQTFDASAYRWTPGQGPSAADYRYTPGQTPDAAQYASGAPNLYQGAMPGTAIETLTGSQVLDQDPGAAFRQSEARKALEASAAARGGLLSGGALQALQARSQDLASQEYGNAWQRMMARNTEQYGRNWNQYLQNWQQGVTGTQLGLQTNAQNFGQAMSAAQLREQVQQVASQQGWSQAQAEAVFREQMAQQSSQQGFGQALGTQQWNQGQAQSYDQDLYNRMMQQAQLRYGQDVTQNQTDYARQQQAYAQQVAELQRQWGNFAQVAGLGQGATNQLSSAGQNNATQMASLLGQLGSAQGMGDVGSALSWQRALGGATNNVTGLLAGLNR